MFRIDRESLKQNMREELRDINYRSYIQPYNHELMNSNTVTDRAREDNSTYATMMHEYVSGYATETAIKVFEQMFEHMINRFIDQLYTDEDFEEDIGL